MPCGRLTKKSYREFDIDVPELRKYNTSSIGLVPADLADSSICKGANFGELLFVFSGVLY